MSMPLPELSFGVDDHLIFPIARGWLELLDDHGLEVLAAELAVVNDDLRLAGTLDRVVRLTRDLTFGDVVVPAGTVLVFDIKTTKLHADDDGLPGYWDSYPIQIAAYAAAIPYDTERDVRLTWEEVLP